MIDLSIVIVNYNAKEYLKKCLDSIFESSFKNFEVIVADNASKDGSVEQLKNLGDKINLILNKENLGFSAANNVGIKKAKGRYLLFLNPDTSVYPNTLKYMVSFMDKNKKVGCSTCKVVLPNGEIDDSCHRGFPTPWNAFCFFSGLEKIFPHSRIFSGYHMGWENLNKMHKIDACAGSFMLVRREAGEDIGWWDEDFFFYGEDLNFCLELQKKGWDIYFIPKVSTLHYKGISSGIKKHSKHLSHADLETKRSATTARFDAMKILYRKHYINKYPRFITWLVFKGVNLKFWLSMREIK